MPSKKLKAFHDFIADEMVYKGAMLKLSEIGTKWSSKEELLLNFKTAVTELAAFFDQYVKALFTFKPGFQCFLAQSVRDRLKAASSLCMAARDGETSELRSSA